VDIYHSTTGTWSTATLSAARSDLAATSVRDLALFGGGLDSRGASSSRVDIYHSTTGTWSTATLSAARSDLAATSQEWISTTRQVELGLVPPSLGLAGTLLQPQLELQPSLVVVVQMVIYLQQLISSTPLFH